MVSPDFPPHPTGSVWEPPPTPSKGVRVSGLARHAGCEVRVALPHVAGSGFGAATTGQVVGDSGLFTSRMAGRATARSTAAVVKAAT